MWLARAIKSASAFWRDLRCMCTATADFLSLARYSIDRLCIAVHGLRFVDRKSTRVARLKSGLRISYRCDSGDLQSIREVLLQEAYRLPSDRPRETIMDLGANIGLASVWLGRKYRAQRIIAIEPDEANCKLARENFQANDIPGVVVQAAIGSRDGTARFQAGLASNRGRIGDQGKNVPLLSVPTVCRQLAFDGSISLLKIDIEGSEEDLLSGDISWLRRVDEIIIEFHPTIVAYDRLVGLLVETGFAYARPSADGLAMDYFRKITP